MNTLPKTKYPSDWFEMIAMAFTFLFFGLIVYFFGVEFFSTSPRWSFWLELSGTSLTVMGALWTALGVRLNYHERKELNENIKKTKVELAHLIQLINSASKFATLGAILILAGGGFLAFKILFFH